MNTTSDSLKNVFQARARLGEGPCGPTGATVVLG